MDFFLLKLLIIFVVAFISGMLSGWLRDRKKTGPGSFEWACKKMVEGHIIYRKSDTGACKYRLSRDGQGRIEWAFSHLKEGEPVQWETANIFLDDLKTTDYAIYKGG